MKRMSRRCLKMNPVRNLFLILGISLTTILLTIVLTAGFTFYQTNQKYQMVSTYSMDADGYIDVNEQQYEELVKQPAVDQIGFIQWASMDNLKNPELLGANTVIVATDDQTIYEMMAVVPIEGTYPYQANEVLMPTCILDSLQIPYQIGETVTLDIIIEGKNTSLDLVMSGYYESITPKTGQTKIFTALSFIDTYHPAIRKVKGSASAFLTLNTLNERLTLEEATEELEKVAQSVGSDKAKIHPKYDSEIMSSSASIIGPLIAGGAGVLLIVLSGYLIIYNIFYISIIRDVKFYGLLKTIGTTNQQIKRLILRQALTLSVVAIPIGLIIGYIVGVILTPMVLQGTYFKNIIIVSKNPILFIAAAIFALITVLISSRKPAIVASKVSPIEAVKYVAQDTIPIRRRSKRHSKGIKLRVMAWHNLLKHKTRVFLSILSIALSATIFIFTINLFMGIDGTAHANNQLVTDVEIRNHYSPFDSEGYQPIEAPLIDELSSLPFVEQVQIYYGALTKFEGETFGSFNGEFLNQGIIKDEFEMYGNPDQDYFLGFNYTSERKGIRTEISSIKAENLKTELERLKVIDGEIDSDAFSSGEYLIWLRKNGDEGIFKAGDQIPVSFVIRDEQGETIIERTLTVMAIVSYPEGGLNDGWVANNLGTITLEEETFKDIYTDYDQMIEKISVQFKPETDIKVANDEISKLVVSEQNSQLQVSSKLFYIEAMEQMKQTYGVVGVVLASILGFIGILNVINTILSGILSRKMELTLLEAVGMTRKQIKTLLLWEGVYYILLSLVFILPLGLLVSYLAPMMIPIYGGFNLTIYLTSVLTVMSFIILLMLSTPLLGYRMVSHYSIVDRLREVE